MRSFLKEGAMGGMVRDWLWFWGRPRADPEAIRALRDRRIRKLVRHAWENVPYYRRLFEEAGVRPDEIRCAEDLKRLPVTTKKQRQVLPLEDKLARGVDWRRCVSHQTSGSTGRPDTIYRTWWEDQVLLLHRFRAGVQLGARPHYRNVNVGITDTKRVLPRWMGLLPFVRLDPYIEPWHVVTELVRNRPHYIRARPTVLEMALIHDTAGDLSKIGTKIVFCGAETMAPATRRRLEEAFRARVFDIYGAHEFNMIAWSCAECGLYHTVDDSVYLEVLKDGRPAGPGEEGDIVATALHSYAMPFIRHETGDVARLPAKPAACRISFGTIESLQGRACEFIRLSSGRVINPTQTFQVLRAVEGVGRFEVVQTARDSIRVTIEPLPQANDPCPEVLRGCRRIFGDDVTIEVASTPELAPRNSEKHRYVRALE
jgi:phenylacetate-CoA ligase